MKLPGPRYVVTGFDGSPNAHAALDRAAAEADRRHARLDVVRVIPAGDGPLRAAAAWLELRGQIARLLPRGRHVTTRLRIVRGEPAAGLVSAAAHAELITVGARLNSGHGDPLGGHTVPAVLSGARCQVVVCDGGDRRTA